MKRIIAVVSLLLMSIGGMFAQNAQNWKQYEIPAMATAVAVDNKKIIFFSEDNTFYQAALPLPAHSGDIAWAQMTVPGTEAVKAGFITADNEIFALKEGGDLYRLSHTQWEKILSGISGINGNSHFCAWDDQAIYLYDGSNFEAYPFAGARALSYADKKLVVSTNNNEVFVGSHPSNLKKGHDLENFETSEIIINDFGEYVAAGIMMWRFGAWYQASVEACVPFTHVLSEGTLSSLAESRDSVWAAGVFAGKGVIFNTIDITKIAFFPESLKMLRGNSDGTLVAIAGNKFYVLNGAKATSGVYKKTSVNIKISPNPVSDGRVIVTAEYPGQYWLRDISGNNIELFSLKKGENILNLPNLAAGVYLLGGQKIICR